MTWPRPWRAWNTFLASLAAAASAFTGAMAAAVMLYVRHGSLTADEALRLLGVLYWGGYPFVFLALGSLGWHFVQHYRGAYARA